MAPLGSSSVATRGRNAWPEQSPVIVDLSSMIVMPLLGGGTVRQVAKKQNGILSDRQQERILEILSNIGAPDGANLEHGDLSNTGNLMADASGKFFLIDFGMVR